MQTLALRTILRKRKRRGRRRRTRKRTRENEKIQIKAISELNLPNLPEEILVEILSRLPLKSLLQFNLVSKDWRSLSWVHFLAPHEIVYFNPRMNKFKKLAMPQPKDGDGDGDILLGLGVLEGCLCMVRRCDEHPSYHVGIVEELAMKEYGKQESWITMFILSNVPNLNLYHVLVPLCSAKNGEVLMKVERDHIRAYNPIDNSQRKVRIPNKRNYLDAIVYEESLVTPPDNNWENEELRGEATYVQIWLSGSWQKMKKIRGHWKTDESSFSDEEYIESDSEELSM